MSKDKNNPKKGNLGGKNDDRGSPSTERRLHKDTRFKKGRSGNYKGRPPKKIEAREHDNPAIHHLMKKVKVIASNGKAIEGRAYDIICMVLTSKSIKGDLKALHKLIELAGGPQADSRYTRTECE